MKSYKLDDKDIIRFISKISVDTNTGCWIPLLKKRKDGYTVFSVKSRYEYLGHRLSFSIFNSDLVSGLVIDHICRNKSCCNPDHLRQVTQEVNAVENTISKIAMQKKKTHCNNGHSLSGSNLRIEKRSLGRHGVCRRCIACANENKRKRYIKKHGQDSKSPETT